MRLNIKNYFFLFCLSKLSFGLNVVGGPGGTTIIQENSVATISSLLSLYPLVVQFKSSFITRNGREVAQNCLGVLEQEADNDNLYTLTTARSCMVIMNNFNRMYAVPRYLGMNRVGYSFPGSFTLRATPDSRLVIPRISRSLLVRITRLEFSMPELAFKSKIFAVSENDFWRYNTIYNPNYTLVSAVQLSGFGVDSNVNLMNYMWYSGGFGLLIRRRLGSQGNSYILDTRREEVLLVRANSYVQFEESDYGMPIFVPKLTNNNVEDRYSMLLLGLLVGYTDDLRGAGWSPVLGTIDGFYQVCGIVSNYRYECRIL